MADKKGGVARLATLTADVWQNPMVGFDVRFAELHRCLEEALSSIRTASALQTTDPVKRAMSLDMHDSLTAALDLFDVIYAVDGNVPDDMFESENFVTFCTLLAAAFGFADQLTATAASQQVFIGPLPKNGLPHVSTTPIASGDQSAAAVFTRNLKDVLRDEKIPFSDFVNKGPIKDSRAAKELLSGRTLPSQRTIMLIARAYRIDADRLMKDIDPELLR